MSASSLSRSEHRSGKFAVLYISLPRLGKRPMGIVVWDGTLDKIYVTQRPIHVQPEGDVSTVWKSLDDLLGEIATTSGGLCAFRWLESIASNTIEMGTPADISVDHPEQIGARLLAQYACTEEAGVIVSNDHIRDSNRNIPVSPSVAVQALTALRSPTVSRDQIEVIVSRDPALVGQLIRASNSAAIHLREPARTLSSALQRLGFDSLRTLIVGLTIKPAFEPAALRPVWDHCVESASIAKQMASALGLSPSEAALAGLLHDIGKVSLHALGEAFVGEYKRLQRQGIPDVLIEKEMVGQSHADLGADLLESWSFPSELRDAVKYHHSPSHSSSKLASLLMLCDSSMLINEDCWLLQEHEYAVHTLGLQSDSHKPITSNADPDFAFLKAST